MQRKKTLGVFFIFLFLAALLLSLSRIGIVSTFRSAIETVIAPIGRTAYGAIGKFQITNTQIDQLKKENLELRKKIVDRKNLEEDLKALRDQFQVIYPRSQSLLPAKIVGSRSFIPNVTEPESIVIDKGTSDGVKEDMVLVVQNNLIGKITQASSHLSLVQLVTHPNSSFAAKTISKNGSGAYALGVVKGQSAGHITLTNVLLSEELNISDIVVTKGDLDLNGVGIPTDLMIGKIVSIDKKPSALFQTASLKSSLDFSRLTTVFVVTQ